MNSKSSAPKLSSSSPLASCRNKYMRSESTSAGSFGSNSTCSAPSRISSHKLSSRTICRKNTTGQERSSSSSTRSKPSTKIRPERRLRSSSSTSSMSSLHSTSSRSVASSSSSTSPRESLRLRHYREHIETSSRIDDMRRQLEKKPSSKALKSFSDRTRISKPKLSASTSMYEMRPAHPKDEVRLSEFTNITTSLSDDEEDVNNGDVTRTLERKTDPSSKRKPSAARGAEDDIFGTMLSKIVDHVKTAASSSSSSSGRNLSSKSDSSNNLGFDDATEHRSNYSKRRLSIQVRRASDFLFSSHHREDDQDEEEEHHHQWEDKVEDTGVDDANDWEF